MFDFSPRTIIAADDIFRQILKAKTTHGIEGVTFLGGEPMLQARGLSRLAFLCQENDVSVMVFTGYRLEDVRAKELPGVENLLACTDILVDGPYIRELPDRERRWTGSRNQRFRYLSARYAEGQESEAVNRESEIAVRLDGTIRVNGWPCGPHLNDVQTK
jgi:anaerobic ribonucleoside-triphosphate reductase activating protein